MESGANERRSKFNSIFFCLFLFAFRKSQCTRVKIRFAVDQTSQVLQYRTIEHFDALVREINRPASKLYHSSNSVNAIKTSQNATIFLIERNAYIFRWLRLATAHAVAERNGNRNEIQYLRYGQRLYTWSCWSRTKSVRAHLNISVRFVFSWLKWKSILIILPFRRSAPCADAYSFCGVRNQKYPDRRPMGYPFDKATASINGQSVRNLSDFATNLSNVAIGECTIRFTNTIIGRSS